MKTYVRKKKNDHVQRLALATVSSHGETEMNGMIIRPLLTRLLSISCGTHTDIALTITSPTESRFST